VRLLVGYGRYEVEEAVERLRRIYALARVWIDGLLSVMKLIGKECDGAKIKKQYDSLMTPYERALAANVMDDETQTAFAAALAEMRPLAPKRTIDAECEQLWNRSTGGWDTTTPTATAAAR